MEAGTEIVTEATPPSLKTSVAQTTLRVVVGLVLLVSLIVLLDVKQLLAAFSSARYEYLIAGALFAILNIGSQVVKWKYLLRLMIPDVSWKVAAMSVFFGNSVGSATPGHVGEFVGRALRVSHDSPVQVIGLAVLDRVQNMFAFTIGAIAVLPVFSFLPVTTAISISITLGVIVLAGGVMGIRIVSKLNLASIRFRWLQNALRSLTLLKPFHWGVTVGWSFVFYAVILIQMFLFLLAFEDVLLVDAIAGFAMSLFAKSFLPISFGDLGVREATSVYFYSFVGVPSAAAFNAAFLMFVANIFVPAIVGVIFTPKLLTKTTASSHATVPHE